MTNELLRAEATFVVLLKDAENLVTLHRAQSVLPGRRVEEPSLNRAVIVLAAAAWQTYVELTAQAIIETLRPSPNDRFAETFELLTQELGRSSERMNTPNTRNVVELFQRVGFDPRRAWSFAIRWTLQVGKTSGRKFEPELAARELDAWLEVRHRVAHGKSLANAKDVREVTSGRTNHGPSLHRGDAEHCIAFFRALVRSTTDAAITQFNLA